ncbi:hypothetical protein [Lactobacillus sp. PV034]|uniref:hypothetical protein n=1 Tax=Lactobacillus sp. PV034 TaxID=2594495 RepID=UPI00223FE9C7|nr:hypothetical protein [Lactobacillus sp. PV034]QNQ80154.1 hypothetical protein FP432_00595 [Lactobacillus sp. PV034]
MSFSNNLRDKNYLSRYVYYTDPKNNEDKEISVGEELPIKPYSYKILDISRNGTYGPHHKYGAKNGMQAMTVAPVNKNGKVDYSHITIAYAGTNTADKADVRTDLENIVAGLPVYVGKI